MPAARPTRRPPAEFRVRFHARLAGATLTTPDAPLPAAPRPVLPPPPPEPVAVVPEPVHAPAPDLTAEFLADRERIEAVLENVRAAAADVRRDLNARLREWQRAAVELAMATATRLLHDRVVTGEFPVEEKVREMVDQLHEDGPITVRLNPADLELLEHRLGGEPLLPGRDDPRVIPDPTLARAECRVEGREGMLLTDVTRELNEIREQLLKDLGNARS
ncbi:hypothetical protein J0H58_36575 [bacterium]|nr:hypothetical protein [bacterium]